MKTNQPKILLGVPKDNYRYETLWTELAEDACKRYGLKVDFIENTPSCTDGWQEAINGYDALISSWCTPQINADILTGNDTLKMVGHAAGSVADLVSADLYEKNIKVTTANDIMAEEVATWCLMMTMIGTRKLLDYACVGGNKPVNWELKDLVSSIHNATIGVWGYGSIAKQYINYLKPFQPKKILVCSNHSSEAQLQQNGVQKSSLEEIFSQTDVIVLLAGMTDKNQNRIGEELLSQIRDGAVLLNCGRARLVQEEALINELDKQRFLACLDVFHEEPLPVNYPLQKMPNVIMTPHNGAASSYSRYVPTVLDEIYRFFNGQPLQYEITRERALTMTSHSKAKGR